MEQSKCKGEARLKVEKSMLFNMVSLLFVFIVSTSLHSPEQRTKSGWDASSLAVAMS
jgi:hypothetical protein